MLQAATVIIMPFKNQKAMIRNILLLAMLTSFVAQANTPQNRQLEEIIARHIDACGGHELLGSVKALELKGQYTGFSEVNDFYTLKTVEGAFYCDYFLGKNRIKEGYDTQTFWTIDPWQGFDFPRKMNKFEQHVLLQKAELVTPFYRWKERGFILELKENENVDGMDMYVVSLIRPGMTGETWYINSKTHLIYKSISPWIDFAVPVEAETYYDDYRQVHGIMFAHFIEQTYRTRHTITEISDITFNPEPDQQLFAMPACPFMSSIATMAGKWNVQVEYMTRTGDWRTFDQVESAFHYVDNMISGNISYDVSFAFSFNFTINYNRQNNLFQLVVYDDFYSVTSLYKGKLTDGVLVFDNLPEGSDEEAPLDNEIMQYVFTLGQEDGFVMERKRFADNSWQDIERLTFN